MKHVGLYLNKIPDKSDSSHLGLAHLLSLPGNPSEQPTGGPPPPNNLSTHMYTLLDGDVHAHVYVCMLPLSAANLDGGMTSFSCLSSKP